MKILFLFMLLAVVACGEKEPDSIPGKIPSDAGPHFGKCVSSEEANALGVSKKCSEPGCVCIEDVHGDEHRKEPHCHSSADKCD